MSHPAFFSIPTHLQTGLSPYQTVFDIKDLSFSWSFPVYGYQTAYRLTVRLGDTGDTVYDSDWVQNSCNTAVTPAGLTNKLLPNHLYSWQVALRYTTDESPSPLQSPFSAPAFFVTAPLVEEAYGLWAGDDDFAFLRHAFTLSKEQRQNASRAILSITAASPEPARQYVYHAHINGQSVGLGPSRTDTDANGCEILYFQSFDVTELLRVGNNCLAATGYATSKKSFFCRLTLYRRDGTPAVICGTDKPEDWQVLPGNQIFRPDHSIGTHYFKAYACNMDGTRYPHGFADAGFDASSWERATVSSNLGETYRLLPSTTANVKVYPAPTESVSVTVTDTGSYLIDLGREIVGGFSLALPPCAPDEITLVYGEELTPDGHVLAPMRTGNHYREHWKLSSEGHPLSTLSLMTYRYVEITNSPIRITPDMVRGLAFHAAFDGSRATLTCDHSLLSRIWKLVKHTVKVTTQDLYVDSQSRERTAYEGDLLINLMAAYACDGDLSVGRFTTRYLCTHRTWPAEYPLFVIISAWEDYMTTGNISFLSDFAPVLERMTLTDYLHCDVGLIASPCTQSSQMNAVLVDWPQTERDGYDMDAPYNTVFNALNVFAYQTLSQIFTALGDTGKAHTYADLARSIKQAMISRLYHPADGGFFDGCGKDSRSEHKSQHATAFCLSCGIYDSASMAEHMASFLAAQGEIRMSVYGAYFLLDGLYKSGHGEIANHLMLSEDASEGARTWAYMLDTLDATVTTEAWNRTNKPNMTYSHPWGAAPAHMIATGIFGITPTSPGYATFDIRPIIPEGLTQATYTLPTMRGKITVGFDARAAVYYITVPFNTTATLHLPDGNGERTMLLSPGEHTITIS